MRPLGLYLGIWTWGVGRAREILADAGNLQQRLFGELGRLRKPFFWAQNANSSVPALSKVSSKPTEFKGHLTLLAILGLIEFGRGSKTTWAIRNVEGCFSKRVEKVGISFRGGLGSTVTSDSTKSKMNLLA